MSPGDFLTILYLYYQDQEAEKRRKREEEAKKKGKYREYKTREKELQDLMSKGVRVPSHIIERIRKQRREAEKEQKESIMTNMNSSNFDVQDLIDEL